MNLKSSKTFFIFMVQVLMVFGCGHQDRSSSHHNSQDYRRENMTPPIKYNSQVDYYKTSKDDQSDMKDVLLMEGLHKMSLQSSNSSLSLIGSPLSNQMGMENEKSDGDLLEALKLCFSGNQEVGILKLKNNYSRYKLLPTAHVAMGNCYFLQDRLQMAILYYQKAIELQKNYTPAINNLGVVHARVGEWQKALTLFKDAHKYSIRSHTPLFNLARTYLKHGLYDLANKSLQILYKMNPSDIELHVFKANIELFRGRFNQSIQIFESLPSDLWKRSDIGINYAIALKTVNQSDKAKSILENIKVENESDLPYFQKAKRFIFQ